MNHNSATSGYGVAALALAAGWLVLCAPWLLGHVSIPYDAKAHFQAQVQFLANALHTGQSPFWNPHIFAGSPQIADPQSLVLSPAVLIALLDPTPSFQLVDGFTFGLLALGGFSILLLFKDRGWHPAGAIVAALAFAFGASAAWRVQHIGQIQSFAFFALALWLLARALDRTSVRWGLAAGFAAALMIVEPNQVAYLGGLVLVGYVLHHWLDGENRWARLRASFRPLLAAGTSCVILSALPLLLTILFILSSSRPSIPFAEATRGSLHPASLLTLIFSDLYGAFDKAVEYWGPFSWTWDPNEVTLSQNMSQLYIGALPIALLLGLGLSRRLLLAREIRFFTIAAVLVTLYALGANTPFYWLLYETLPGVALFRRPADATFRVGGMLAILSGYLVHRWVTNTALAAPERPRLRLKAILILAITAAAIAVAVSQDKLDAALRPMAISFAWLAASAGILLATRLGGRMSWAAVPALAAVLTADLALNNGPNESTALPRENFTMLDPDAPGETIRIIKELARQQPGSPRRDRVELAGLGFEWPNAAMVHGFDHTLGYNPLRLADFTRAVGAEDSIVGPNQRRFTPLFPSYRCRLANLLGLRYIVSPIPIERIDRTMKSTDLRFMARTPDGYVYENTEALPRALFVRNWQLADFNRIMRDGKWPPADPRSTVLLDRRPAMTTPSMTIAKQVALQPATVRITRYENTVIDIEVVSGEPGFVVLNDVWHPWWFASVDGRPTPVLKANVLFRAVAVGPGRHAIRFEFAPVAGALQELRAKLGVYRSSSTSTQ